LTLYKLPMIMEGDMQDIVHALQVARGTELLAELEQRVGV
ncbi:MAG: peptide chain release factor 1, partial [Burkholderiaceae bacterium]